MSSSPETSVSVALHCNTNDDQILRIETRAQSFPQKFHLSRLLKQKTCFCGSSLRFPESDNTLPRRLTMQVVVFVRIARVISIPRRIHSVISSPAVSAPPRFQQPACWCIFTPVLCVTPGPGGQVAWAETQPSRPLGLQPRFTASRGSRVRGSPSVPTRMFTSLICTHSSLTLKVQLFSPMLEIQV